MYPRHRRTDATGLVRTSSPIAPEQHVRDGGLLNRAQGCLLGQLAGDALGSAVEFLTPQAIQARYPDGLTELIDGGTYNTIAGQPTDDSELALALARVISRSHGYSEEGAARAYGYWLQSRPFDLGATTARALSAIPPVVVPLVARDGHPSTGHVVGGYAADAARSAADSHSEANGALMRISPLGIWGHATDPSQLAEIARIDSRLTHPSPVSQDACAVFVVAIAHAIATGASATDVYAFTREWAKANVAAPSVLEALTAAEDGPPADFLTDQGWVLLALRNAFAQLLRAESAEEGIVATAKAGGDTDTNAAIAGALLGAVHGRDSIPARWRNLILTCRPIDGAPGVHRPRPEVFWPVDALELAERLLTVGSRNPGR
jgi:ADP-ribosylglycohydrolase